MTIARTQQTDLRNAGELPADQLHALRERMLALVESLMPLIQRVPEPKRASARNLVHYLAFRRHDLRRLQRVLSLRGLSSLGRSEAAVLASVDAVLGNLAVLDGSPPPPIRSPDDVPDLDAGHRLLDERTASVLGPRPPARVVRVMVTMPSEAGDDPGFPRECAAAGMDLARINAARETPETIERMIEHLRRTADASQRSIRILLDLPGPKIRVDRVLGIDGATEARVFIGDRIAMPFDDPQPADSPARVRATVTHPHTLRKLKPGDRVAFDDGKIVGVCETRADTEALVRIDAAPIKGAKLRTGRGVNLPDTVIDMPALDNNDHALIHRFGRSVDLIGLSFARTPSDLELLFDALERAALHEVGVVLKLETRQGFDHLPELLLTLLRWPSSALMIARGDLAVECGFERLAEVQEEIMWFCEASHTPIIWATQVLESLAREGKQSRAEITDAAMAQRAECVMLNKGPYALQAVRMLDDLLRRMAAHQRKKTPMLRALRVADTLAQ